MSIVNKMKFKTSTDYFVWFDTRLVPVAKKGERWYERLNKRYDLERKERGRVIAIDVRTGKYVIAETLQRAKKEAKKRFGMTHLFINLLHPYVKEAIVQVVDFEGVVEHGWPYVAKAHRFERACERWFVRLKGERRRLHGEESMIIDAESGRYVVGKTFEDAEEKADVAFPFSVGKRAYGYLTDGYAYFFYLGMTGVDVGREVSYAR